MISVIIATHNGAHTLPRMLEALALVHLPEQGAEFIAVDNASTDDTYRILLKHTERLPLRALTEPRAGKSFALNRGIAEASGDLLLFTDDDVVPEKTWLTAYAAAAKARREVGLFAGQVRHDWEAPPPRWLERLAAAGLSYAGTREGREEGPIAPNEVKGLNLMVRRDSLGPVRFCEDEGVNFTRAVASVGGEDTRFAREVLARGVASWFVPNACLRHIVRVHQIGIRPVFQRYVRIGGAIVLRNPDYYEGRAHVFGLPAVELSYIARHTLRGLYRLTLRQPETAARHMVNLALTFGKVRQWRMLRRHVSRQENRSASDPV